MLSITDETVYDLPENKLWEHATALMTTAMKGHKFITYPSKLGSIAIDPLGFKKMIFGHLQGKETDSKAWPPRINGQRSSPELIYKGRWIDELVASIPLLPAMIRTFKDTDFEPYRNDRVNLRGIEGYAYMYGPIEVNGIKFRAKIWVRKYDVKAPTYRGETPYHYYYHSIFGGQIPKALDEAYHQIYCAQ